MIDLAIFGWFDDAGATPAHDPGLTVPCPVCSQPFTKQDCVCISTLPAEPDDERRSYFFRAHKTCWLNVPMGRAQEIETFPFAHSRRARMHALSMSGNPVTPEELEFAEKLE